MYLNALTAAAPSSDGTPCPRILGAERIGEVHDAVALFVPGWRSAAPLILFVAYARIVGFIRDQISARIHKTRPLVVVVGIYVA
jgi:hypothetical protein